MNRLVMVIATGFLASFLTACGDNNAPKPAENAAVAVPAQDQGTNTNVVVPPTEQKNTDGTPSSTETPSH